MISQENYELYLASQSATIRLERDALATVVKELQAENAKLREAWEAMVEAITQLCEDADEHDLLRDYVTVDRVLYENLTAALAKARGE